MKQDQSIVVRIKNSTKKLALAMNKGSVDEGIKFMWKKICLQGKTINELKNQIKKAKEEEGTHEPKTEPKTNI